MGNKFIGFFILLVIFRVGDSATCSPKLYYISPNGDDNNSGLKKRKAWKTIERVNKMMFQPGDAILFESGGVWNGNLRPLGSGERENRITISSYGKDTLRFNENETIRFFNSFLYYYTLY